MTYAIQCGLKVRISTSTLLEYLNKRVENYLFRHFLLFSEACFVYYNLQQLYTFIFCFETLLKENCTLKSSWSYLKEHLK